MTYCVLSVIGALRVGDLVAAFQRRQNCGGKGGTCSSPQCWNMGGSPHNNVWNLSAEVPNMHRNFQWPELRPIRGWALPLWCWFFFWCHCSLQSSV